MPVSPSVIATAANVPAIQVNSAFRRFVDAYNQSSPPSLFTSAMQIQLGESALLGSKLDWNTQILENLACYGAVGAYALSHGLDVSDGGGLTAIVSAGHATTTSLVEFSNADNIVLQDAAVNYIWLRSDAILDKVLNSLTPPHGDCVFLAAVTVAGGVITAIDYSGRCYVAGGILYRETGDVWEPSDTPTAGVRHITATQNGSYLHDGIQYTAVQRVGAQNLASGNARSTPVVVAATLALTPTSPNVLHFTSTADRIIKLADPANCVLGHSHLIYNNNLSGGHIFTVTDHTGGVTKVILGPQMSIMLTLANVAGTIDWVPPAPVVLAPDGTAYAVAVGAGGAGFTLRGNGSPSPSPDIPKYLAASVTTVGTGSLESVPDLSMVTGPGEVWAVRMYLRVGSSDVNGVNYGLFSRSGGDQVDLRYWGTDNAHNAFDSDHKSDGTATAKAFNTAGLTTAEACAILEVSLLYIAPVGSAGGFTFGQQKVTAGVGTIYAGSYMIARRIS